MPLRLGCATLLAVVVSFACAPAAAPPAGVDSARVKVLMHRLDADSFDTRQKADDTLRALGKAVLPMLTQERARTTSLEVRHRLDRMIHDLTIDERIPGLVQMLGHDDPRFGAQAEFALRQAGNCVVPLLKKELKPTLDGPRRQRIEKIIAELSSPGR